MPTGTNPNAPAWTPLYSHAVGSAPQSRDTRLMTVESAAPEWPENNNQAAPARQQAQKLVMTPATIPNLGGSSGYSRIPVEPKILVVPTQSLDVESCERDTRRWVAESPAFPVDHSDANRSKIVVRYAVPRPRPAILPMRPKG